VLEAATKESIASKAALQLTFDNCSPQEAAQAEQLEKDNLPSFLKTRVTSFKIIPTRDSETAEEYEGKVLLLQYVVISLAM
jgi:hypothetical protein